MLHQVLDYLTIYAVAPANVVLNVGLIVGLDVGSLTGA